MWLRDFYEFGTLGQVVMWVLLMSAHGHLRIKGPMSLSAGAAGSGECSKAVNSCVTPFCPARDHWGFPSSIGFATAPL
jgi:hypothetical protein